ARAAAAPRRGRRVAPRRAGHPPRHRSRPPTARQSPPPPPPPRGAGGVPGKAGGGGPRVRGPREACFVGWLVGGVPSEAGGGGPRVRGPREACFVGWLVGGVPSEAGGGGKQWWAYNARSMTDTNGHGVSKGTFRVKSGHAEMLKGGVIMDVVTADDARIAEEAGACAVMALERVPADIRNEGGVARMSDPALIKSIM